MKNVLLILSALFFFSFSQAQCVEGNCYNGFGVYKFKDGSLFRGNFLKSKLQGYGKMKYSNGNIYEGEWRNDLKSGKGTMRFTNQDSYAGNFRDDKFWGKGIYRYNSGDIYDGSWVNGKAHGKGKYIFADKEKYEGDFFKGLFEGVGAFYYSDGSIFIGNWKNNKRNGEGKLHYKDGRKIAGFWKDDQMVDESNGLTNTAIKEKDQNDYENNGSIRKRYWRNCNNSHCHQESGELNYQDGSVWQGEFLNGQPHGVGVLKYADGNKYEGEVADHAPNGEGVMYFSSGQVVGGTWNNGYPIRKKQRVEKKQSEQIVEVDYDDDVKIWAVIVGVSSYAHMPSLKYTDDDAYQIYAFLKSPEGGALPNDQIRLLIDENATRQNILAGMNDVLLKADENDVVLMYYSGHGLPGMFLPIDFDGYSNNLSHKEVLDVFKNSKAKHKLCIADACHSGSLLASRSPFNQQMEEFYQEYNNTSGGTALIMSSKSEEVSLETSGLRQGIFSHYLIRGLNGEADNNKNDIVTVTELFDFISIGVKQYTRNAQQPSIAGNYDENMPVSTVRKRD
jgi:hypothetical protein